MDRHALPEPPSCVSRGTASAIVTKPAVSPDFTSESGVPRNGSRAVSTIQDLKPSSKLTVGGWDSSSVAEHAATSTASQLLTTVNHVTPTTLIQSRTVTQTSSLDSPSTPTPTLAIPDLIPPPPTSAYPTPLSEAETITQYPDLETVTIDNGNGQKPLHYQATADLGGTTLIRVALSRILDFQTLVEHPAATMQLFDLVPLLLSLYGSIPPGDIRVHEIIPLRSTDDGGSITAVAHVYCSADQVANLRHAFWDPVSQLYSLRHEHLATVADMFGELSSLLNLACRPQSATIAALLGTCAPQAIRIQRDEHAVTPGRPFVPAWFKDHLLGGVGADKDVARDFVTRAPATPNQAFWSIAFVFAPLIVLAYSFAMIFVARRYKAKKRRALASLRLSAGAKSSGFAVSSDIKEADFLHHSHQMTGIPS
ncbi:hypothetical protein BR93DRAFT_262032 [Coniochaeta sp. PMI_546]|nr:hypothetical protein BR93DRAFT_262032 [Coniochaeta sp. PMI_546]